MSTKTYLVGHIRMTKEEFLHLFRDVGNGTRTEDNYERRGICKHCKEVFFLCDSPSDNLCASCCRKAKSREDKETRNWPNNRFFTRIRDQLG